MCGFSLVSADTFSTSGRILASYASCWLNLFITSKLKAGDRKMSSGACIRCSDSDRLTNTHKQQVERRGERGAPPPKRCRRAARRKPPAAASPSSAGAASSASPRALARTCRTATRRRPRVPLVGEGSGETSRLLREARRGGGVARAVADRGGAPHAEGLVEQCPVPVAVVQVEERGGGPALGDPRLCKGGKRR